MIGMQRNSGFALLMLLVVLLGMTTLAFSNILSNSVRQKADKKQDKNREALIEAKEALLAFSVDFLRTNSLDAMGRLPCPDATSSNSQGAQDTNCGSRGVNAVGYLPYRTLGLSKIEDGSGTCLWYAVSGTYKNDEPYELVNRDTPGYLALENENGFLLHGDSEDDYPVALIISPGENLGGDRSIDASFADSVECKGSYIVAAYLEGGGNIDITDDHPQDPHALWPFLSVSNAVELEGEAYNDRVIAIYRNEIWDRVDKLNQLDFNNSAGVAPASSIEKLTESIAECIVAYGNENADRMLALAAPVDLNSANDDDEEYREEDNYNNVAGVHHGRIAQNLDAATSPESKDNFFFKAIGESFCSSKFAGGSAPAAPPVQDYDQDFWSNWKDHFFYMVSEDFDHTTATPLTNRCASNCISIDPGDGTAEDVAAVILFAGKAEPGISRMWWWDEDDGNAPVDQKANIANYLEGDFGTAEYTGGDAVYTLTATDYAYCVVYDNGTNTFSATKCADL
jgi:hypothetical protein